MFALLKNSFRTCFLSDFILRCFDLMSQVAGRTKQSFMRLGLTVQQFCIFSLFVLCVTIFWRCEFSIGQMPNAGGIFFDSKIGEVVVLNIFFPTSLCGVLVFDSVSRAPPPPPPAASLIHTIHTHIHQQFHTHKLNIQ